MTGSTVSLRQSLISWSILLALLFSMVGFVLIPWWKQMADYEQTLSQNRALLQKYKSVLISRPALEARLKDPQNEVRMLNDYLKGKTAALAAAELQQKIKAIIGTVNGKLVSTQTLPVQDMAPASKVLVRVRMRSNTEALLNVLHGLESERPLLFVEKFTIRRYQRRRNRNPEELDIHFDLSGYMRQSDG